MAGYYLNGSKADLAARYNPLIGFWELLPFGSQVSSLAGCWLDSRSEH